MLCGTLRAPEYPCLTLKLIQYTAVVTSAFLLQSWSDENLARTRSARHKLLKFLRDHSAMTIPKAGLQTPPAPHLETMEILDNSLRQPLDQGRAARAEPLAVKSKAHWLTVQCMDKPGSLADIARAIAQHEQNIKVR